MYVCRFYPAILKKCVPCPKFDWYFRSILREHRASGTTLAKGKNWHANKFNYMTESDEPLFATLDCCMTNTNTTTDDLTQMR